MTTRRQFLAGALSVPLLGSTARSSDHIMLDRSRLSDLSELRFHSLIPFLRSGWAPVTVDGKLQIHYGAADQPPLVLDALEQEIFGQIDGRASIDALVSHAERAAAPQSGEASATVRALVSRLAEHGICDFVNAV